MSKEINAVKQIDLLKNIYLSEDQKTQTCVWPYVSIIDYGET